MILFGFIESIYLFITKAALSGAIISSIIIIVIIIIIIILFVIFDLLI